MTIEDVLEVRDKLEKYCDSHYCEGCYFSGDSCAIRDAIDILNSVEVDE